MDDAEVESLEENELISNTAVHILPSGCIRGGNSVRIADNRHQQGDDATTNLYASMDITDNREQQADDATDSLHYPDEYQDTGVASSENTAMDIGIVSEQQADDATDSLHYPDEYQDTSVASSENTAMDIGNSIGSVSLEMNVNENADATAHGDVEPDEPQALDITAAEYSTMEIDDGRRESRTSIFDECSQGDVDVVVEQNRIQVVEVADAGHSTMEVDDWDRSYCVSTPPTSVRPRLLSSRPNINDDHEATSSQMDFSAFNKSKPIDDMSVDEIVEKFNNDRSSLPKAHNFDWSSEIFGNSECRIEDIPPERKLVDAYTEARDDGASAVIADARSTGNELSSVHAVRNIGELKTFLDEIRLCRRAKQDLEKKGIRPGHVLVRRRRSELMEREEWCRRSGKASEWDRQVLNGERWYAFLEFARSTSDPVYAVKKAKDAFSVITPEFNTKKMSRFNFAKEAVRLLDDNRLKCPPAISFEYKSAKSFVFAE
jgi:hypothetical protein